MCKCKKYCNALVKMLCDVEKLTHKQIMQETQYPSNAVGNIISRHCQKHVRGVVGAEYHTTVIAKIDDIEKDYLSGMSTYMLAEKYGCHRSHITRLMKKRGHKRYKGYMPSGAKQDHSARLEVLRKETEEKYVKRISEISNGKIEYIGGFTKTACKIKLRCTVCGREFEATAQRRVVFSCPGCKEREADKRIRQKKIASIEAQIKRLKEKKVPKTCSHCGRVFYSEYETKKYCSDECSRKAQHARRHMRDKEQKRSNNHRKRARKYGATYTPGITLKKLYERDSGICHICGEQCSWDSKEYGTCGPDYPSIDHVVPLSKGGSHTWENVKLAHHLCNGAKSDNVEGVANVIASNNKRTKPI